MGTVMQLYLVGGVLAAAWLRVLPDPNEMPTPTWVAILAGLIWPVLLLAAVVMRFVPEETEA